MSSRRPYARVRSALGCLGVLLAVFAFGAVVFAAFAVAVMREVERESP